MRKLQSRMSTTYFDRDGGENGHQEYTTSKEKARNGDCNEGEQSGPGEEPAPCGGHRLGLTTVPMSRPHGEDRRRDGPRNCPRPARSARGLNWFLRGQAVRDHGRQQVSIEPSTPRTIPSKDSGSVPSRATAGNWKRGHPFRNLPHSAATGVRRRENGGNRPERGRRRWETSPARVCASRKGRQCMTASTPRRHNPGPKLGKSQDHPDGSTHRSALAGQGPQLHHDQQNPDTRHEARNDAVGHQGDVAPEAKAPPAAPG